MTRCLPVPARAALAATLLLLGAALPASSAAAAEVSAATVTFDHRDAQGWHGPDDGGNSGIALRLGNDRPAYRTRFEDFGIAFVNETNPAFVGDYTAVPAFAFSVDVNTLALTFSGTSVTRDLVLELRDHDGAPEGFPYVSVWTRIGTLDPSQPGWHTLSATVADTRSTALPAGWGGYGAEDPVTFEPILPEGRTFANVLAGVDEIALTTLVPGQFYGFTRFDVAIDNLTLRPLAAVPEPAPAALLAAGLAGLALVRRRPRAATTAM